MARARGTCEGLLVAARVHCARPSMHAMPPPCRSAPPPQVVRDHTQSPTEFDSTPKCAELLQDFFVRLVGSYRRFVRPDDGVTPAALALGIDRPVVGPASTPGGTPGGGSRAGSVSGRDAPEDEHQRCVGGWWRGRSTRGSVAGSLVVKGLGTSTRHAAPPTPLPQRARLPV